MLVACCFLPYSGGGEWAESTKPYKYWGFDVNSKVKTQNLIHPRFNKHRIHSSLGYLTPVQYRMNTLKNFVYKSVDNPE